jgi:surfeit locus 1 family protein
MTSAGGVKRRPLVARLGFLGLSLLTIAGLFGLGVWQIQRRSWKLDLIARVDRRIAAPPVAAPGPAAWPAISVAKDEYLRIRVAGHFLNDRESFVQALTEFGDGFWVLTPLKTDQGFIVLVNRGFVPPDRRVDARHDEIAGETGVTGLLRLSEPKGRFLRPNDPAQNRWYSRDVAAIAAARGLGPVAPYFIDAEASGTNNWPRGGLTVVTFPNNHLVYALTWFSLALMLAGVTLYNVREDRRRRRGAETENAGDE